MDLYDESRSLVYSGPVSRRIKSDSFSSSSWGELYAALLDNYCKYTLLICIVVSDAS